MHHVNAGDLPGNEVSRTFEGGRHGPCSVSFFLVHNQHSQGHAAPAMKTEWVSKSPAATSPAMTATATQVESLPTSTSTA
jgi:hypothetical protein